MKSLKKIISILLALMLMPSVYAAENTENIAAGAQAEVSFFDSDGKFLNADTTGIAGLTDDNSFSLYKTPVGVEKGEVIIDLYYQSDFNRVYLREINSTITGFEVYTSPNKREWSRRYTGETVGTYGANACFDKTVRARYVKIAFTAANKYKDASVTFSDIKVYNMKETVKDDLETALHLADVKKSFITSDAMRGHFSDDDREKLENEIKNARSVLEDGGAAQYKINKAAAALAKLTNSLECEGTAEDFAVVEQRYLDFFVKNDQELTESRKKTIAALEDEVEDIRNKMIRRPKASELWAEYTAPMANSTQEPGKIANSLAKLKKLAIAYKQDGNKFKGDKAVFDDIVYGLDFILTNKYAPSIEMYGNWYYWQISVPATMTDIMVILKSDLTEEMLSDMEKAIISRIGNDFHYTWYGANRMYLAAISLKLGASRDNAEYIHRAVYSLSEENACKDKQSLNSSGDDNGYFWDGSYMFHSGILYNATYGRDQLSNTLSIIGYLYETPWQIEQGMIEDMASRVHDVYEYVIYNGYSVDVAAGRGLGEGKSYALNIANSIEQTAKYLSGDEKTELLSIAKQFKIEQGVEDALTEDESIPARGRITKLKRYPIGDKLILHTPQFGFALSMFSDRTKCFEAPNGDAMKAWYVSSGMTQLLNSDREQYDRNYWISVDHYRLAGTTVDRVERSLTRYEGEIYNANDWCGMIDADEKYGVAGMMGCNWNSSMTAKKSYFMFDDEILCLGTDISKGTANIETTVENRKLKDDKSNRITVNGTSAAPDRETTVKDVSTVWLEGNTEDSSIGYFFPKPAELHMLRETRTAAEADMWLSDTKNKVTKNYFTMWYNHGKQPDNASYEYVILPNFTEEQTKEYSENPDVEVLDMNSTVHSARDKTIGVTGYNFWSKQGGKGTGAAADGCLSLITRDSDGVLEVSMTDPTFKTERAVSVELEQSVSEITECDPRIEVISTSPLRLKVNLKDVNGRKITLKAKNG